MSDECWVSELGAYAACEKLQQERDAAIAHRDDYETRFIELGIGNRRLQGERDKARATVALLRRTASLDLVEAKMQREQARSLARELRDLLAAFPTVSLRGIDDTYPWLAEKETP